MTVFTADNIPETNEIQVDICIIGSGAGGSITAARMSTQGFDILVLEEGDYVKAEDFTQDENKLIRKMYRRGGALATDNMGIRILQGKVYGGSTTINWMNCFRTPDYVLDEWEKYDKLENYSVKDLEPHFENIEQRLSVHEIPSSDHSRQNKIILQGAEELGIHAGPCKNNSSDCIGCGKCGLGCYYDAKQDMRLTYLQDARDDDATIYCNTKAVKIDYLSKDKQEIHAEVNGRESVRKLKIIAKRTVVSGGAIMTPLLLQESGLTKSGNVGKYLHIHPVVGTSALYEDEINPTYGIPMSAYSYEYKDLGAGYGFWHEVPDLEVFLAGVNMPGTGSERRDLMKQMNNMGVIITLTRDGRSRTSNGSVSWRRGLNLQNGHFSLSKYPSIRYNLDDADKNIVLKGLRNAIEMHFAAGAKMVIPMHSSNTKLHSPDQIDEFMKLPMGPNQLSFFSAHPTGTARMSNVLSESVVDETMQMRHYPGVYVMDGSTLPTAPGVNPMITILGCISRAIELGNLGL